MVTTFTQQMPESSDSMYSSILMLENIWYLHFTYSGPNSQEIVNLYQFSSDLRGPTIGTKLTISFEFSPLQVKWWYTISSMKKEEYMESELSGIFRVKVVTKNVWVKTIFFNNFSDQTVTQYTSLLSLLNSTLVWFMWKNVILSS